MAGEIERNAAGLRVALCFSDIKGVSEQYQGNAKPKFEDLRQIREKYGLQPPRSSFKRPVIAKNEVNYRGINSEQAISRENLKRHL